MMRRRILQSARTAAAIGVGSVLFFSLSIGGSGIDYTGNVSYRGNVNTMVDWITDKQAASTPNGVTTWNNAMIATTDSDSVAIMRLVLNKNSTLTAPTQQILTHSSTAETLATYYRISSDGNGSSATGITSSGNGIGSFIYVGGGATQWETNNGLTPATFIPSGATVTHVNADGAALITVTVRGWNGEDFGSDSDLTEAPEKGTYSAQMTLVAAEIP